MIDVEACPGPPCVDETIKSYTFNDPVVIPTVHIVIEGANIGIVTLKNLFIGLAPSTLAASYNSAGI